MYVHKTNEEQGSKKYFHMHLDQLLRWHLKSSPICARLSYLEYHSWGRAPQFYQKSSIYLKHGLLEADHRAQADNSYV